MYQFKCLAVSTNFLFVTISHDPVAEYDRANTLRINSDTLNPIGCDGTLNDCIFTKFSQPFWRLARVQLLVTAFLRNALKNPCDINWYSIKG